MPYIIYTLYCLEAFIKTFCSSLREHAVNIIQFEKKEKVTVNKKEPKLHHDETVYYITV